MIKAEVEVKSTISKVRIDAGRYKARFLAGTTDKEELLREIASRVELSVEDIRPYIIFKNGVQKRTSLASRIASQFKQLMIKVI